MRALAVVLVLLCPGSAGIAEEAWRGADLTMALAGSDGFGVEYGNLVLAGAMAGDPDPDRVAATPPAVFGDTLTFHAGYQFGPALGYAVMAGDRQKFKATGRTAGALQYGLGLALAVTNGLVLSGEATRRYAGDDTTSGASTEDRFSMKVSFRF